MQIVSNCGVELRKQNITVRQMLEVYRPVVRYLTKYMGRCGKNCL